MGNLVPSQSDQDLIKSRSGQNALEKIADIYLSSEITRTEQLNTANAIIAASISMVLAEAPDLTSYDQCVKAVCRYFETSAMRNVRPTITGIASTLGLSRIEFINACESGFARPKCSHDAIALPNDVWHMFSQLKDNYVSMIEGFLESNLIQPAAGAFLLKNNGGYKDVVEQNVSVTNYNVDVNALVDKYKDYLV